jgi:hypothetical protein
MPYVTTEAEVWVDLDEFETEDLVAELKHRNTNVMNSIDLGPSPASIINEIYMAKHVRNQNYDQLIDDLIYAVLGKIS